MASNFSTRDRLTAARDTLRHASTVAHDEAHATDDLLRRAWLLGRVSGLDQSADLLDVLLRRWRR